MCDTFSLIEVIYTIDSDGVIVSKESFEFLCKISTKINIHELFNVISVSLAMVRV